MSRAPGQRIPPSLRLVYGQRIRDAMLAASKVEDGPGVEGHVSGNGKRRK